MTNFFGPGSPYLTHPLLTEERTRLEVDRILDYRIDTSATGRGRGVLDVGCGFGRHALEFARRGWAVVAVDPSRAMLDEARDRAEAAGLDIEFVQSTGQEFRRVAAFDLVVSLFTSFGQIPSGCVDDGAPALIENMASALRPGGTLVIEVPERSRALAALVVSEELGTTNVRRRFDEGSAQIHETFTTPTATFDLAYRIYEHEELCALLEGFGLFVVDVVGEALVVPPGTFMTIVAERI